MQSVEGETCRIPHRPKMVRRRREWLRGDVRCLSCSRLVGRLLGTRTSGFFAYKAAGFSTLVVAYTPETAFRCEECGGTGALDDVELIATYERRPAYARAA